MRRHGGHAEVRSTPGEGTEVALTLPHSGRDSS
jgi:signal transduction histidine kinase